MAKTRKNKSRVRKTRKRRINGGNNSQPVPTKFPAVLVMYDPDAPVSKAKKAAWLHHLRVYNSATDYKDIVPYMPPSPPKGSGVHLYITEIYELNTIPTLKGFNSKDRSSFNIQKFRDNNKLVLLPHNRTHITINSK